MTKHESAREIVRQEGGCTGIACSECPLEWPFNCSLETLNRANSWLIANPEVTEQEGVPYWYPEHKESPMPKYKIDPIPGLPEWFVPGLPEWFVPGLPEWFVPGIFCRVRDTEDEAWRKPRRLVGFTLPGHYRFMDENGEFFRFADPVAEWEPKEGEYCAAFEKGSESFIILQWSDDLEWADHYARLSYPDGRVIDCACSVEELKQRTDWL